MKKEKNEYIVKNRIYYKDINGAQSIKKIIFSGEDSFIEGFENIIDDFISLQEVIVSKNHNFYYSKSGVLFSKNKKEFILYPPMKQTTTYRIPRFVKTIKKRSLFRANLLKKLVIGLNVSEIEENSIGRIQNLQTLVLPFIGTKLNSNDYFCSIFKATRKEYEDELPYINIITPELDPLSDPGYEEIEIDVIMDNYKIIGDTHRDVSFGDSYFGFDISDRDYSHYMENHGGYHPELGDYMWDDPYDHNIDEDEDKESNNNVCFMPNSLKKIVILSGSYLPSFSFNEADFLEKIVIPSSLESVGEDCFQMKKIIIPKRSKLKDVDYGNSAYFKKFKMPKNLNADSVHFARTENLVINDVVDEEDFNFIEQFDYKKIKINKRNPYLVSKNKVVYNKTKTKILWYSPLKKNKTLYINKNIINLNINSLERNFFIRHILVDSQNKHFYTINNVLYDKKSNEVILDFSYRQNSDYNPIQLLKEKELNEIDNYYNVNQEIITDEEDLPF